ncbi:MAG: ABC transporter substrate-binding protein [Leptolyngbyaceae cyanobacterium MO_188.B28]|nr:ABC transporter substrate-binding protein [Leptolyngbyaceae cyanobacterium MO_188.B28]
MPSLGSIFISYRRSDSSSDVGRIYDYLENHFGRDRIFKDVDSIPLGVNFREHLDQEVGRCKVFIAVIGPKWLIVTDDDGERRLDSSTDWVRIEIESALKRGIPIIPLLVNGARMPKVDDLPGDLKALTDWQNALIRHDPDFRRDVRKLIQGIESLLNAAETVSEPVVDETVSETNSTQPPALLPNLSEPPQSETSQPTGAKTDKEFQTRPNSITKHRPTNTPKGPVKLTVSVDRWKRWAIGGSLGLIGIVTAVYIAQRPSVEELLDSKRSLGEEFLIPEKEIEKKKEIEEIKQVAANSFKDRDYEAAIKKLKILLQIKHNDPEALIYLNNAEAARQKKIDKDTVIVKIGVSVPISGIKGSRDRAEEILRGVAHAQSKENCGEIDYILEEINNDKAISCDEGRQKNKFLLQVEIADDENQETVARQVAKNFGDDPSILAVVGHNASRVTKAAIETYDEFKLTAISPTSSETNLVVNKPFLFRTVPNNEKIAETFIQYANGKIEGKISVCYNSESSFSNSLADEIYNKEKEFGNNNFSLTKKGECNFNETETQKSFSDLILLNIEENNSTGLFVIPSIGDTSLVVEAIDYVKGARGLKHVVASPSMYLGAILNGDNKNILGTVVLTPWDPSIDQDEQKFAEEAEKLWKASVGTWRTPMAYDAVLAIVHALNRLKANSNREEIQGIMSSLEFNGVTGKVQFESGGDRIGSKIYFAEIVSNTSDTHKFQLIPEI